MARGINRIPQCANRIDKLAPGYGPLTDEEAADLARMIYRTGRKLGIWAELRITPDTWQVNGNGLVQIRKGHI